MKKAPPKKRSVAAKRRKKVSAKKLPLKDRIIGFAFLILALFALMMPIPNITQKENKSSKEPIKIDKKLLEPKKGENLPTQIIMPEKRIDLKVTPSKVVDGYWETSETTASYGLGSGVPGSKSNTVIFAHAREGLFYNLRDVKIDDTVYVLTKNKWYRYKISKITSVYPNQKEVILPTKNETLTLYTCTGFNDEKRLVVSASPF